MSHKAKLILEDFFPYQLTKLQVLVSDKIAQIYTGEFNLSRQEWRVLAILANNPQLTAKQIGELANLEKMPASRAIKKMQDKDLLTKGENSNDKRSSLLSLTENGLKLFTALEPMVLKREQEIVSLISENEQQALKNLIAKLNKISS